MNQERDRSTTLSEIGPIGGTGTSTKKDDGAIREFWRFTAGYRAPIAFALAVDTVATLCTLALPAATKIAVDSGLGNQPLAFPWNRIFTISMSGSEILGWLAIAVVGIGIVGAVLRLIGYWSISRAAELLRNKLRLQIFDHAIHLPLHRVQELKSGGAASILRDDAGCIAELVVDMIYFPWRAIIQLAGALAILILVDWRLFVGFVVVFPIVYFSHLTWFSRIFPLEQRVRRQREDNDSRITESFAGIRVVRAFGMERREALEFVRRGHQLTRLRLRLWWLSRFLEFMWELAIPMSSAAVLLYGGWCVRNGSLSLGDLIMFLVYLAIVIGPMGLLVNTLGNLQPRFAAFNRILELLNEPREDLIASARSAPIDPRGFESISFKGVYFRYPGASEMVLRNIDFDIASGETVALVGPSGAGKTTLTNLLVRFYDPTSGLMELNGEDVRASPIARYRGLFAIVDQDVVLFDGTVADNIAYSNRHATRAQLRQAAESAYAHKFIESLPGGYDAIVGERGVRLSGGQRQRLALARALLADRQILILDEATSHLDSHSESMIRRTLHQLMRTRTCLIIAHRLSTWIHADRIVVLDSGEIIDIGSHRELMERCASYQRLVESQDIEELTEEVTENLCQPVTESNRS
jgi:ATP-binding cassette subfamily B protein/subfamily B ATP-binding cassette protein MsbA